MLFCLLKTLIIKSNALEFKVFYFNNPYIIVNENYETEAFA